MERLCPSLTPIWDKSSKDFAPCFQYVILPVIPCVQVWATSILLYLATSQRRSRSSGYGALDSWRQLVTLVFCLLSCSLVTGQLLFGVAPPDRYDVLCDIITTISALGAILFFHMEVMKKSTDSIWLSVFWSLQSLAVLIRLQSSLRRLINNDAIPFEESFAHYGPHRNHLSLKDEWSDWRTVATGVVGLTAAFLYIFFKSQRVLVHDSASRTGLVNPLLVVPNTLSLTAGRSEDDSVDTFDGAEGDGVRQGVNRGSTSPEVNAGVLSKLTFAWMSPLITVGKERPLDQPDLYPLHPSEQGSVLYTRFYSLLRSEWNSHTTGERSLIKVMAKFIWRPFLRAGLLKLGYDSLLFLSPLLLNNLIKFVQDYNWGDADTRPPASKGYLLVVGMFSTSMGGSFILHQYFHIMFRLGLRTKSALNSSVYDKSLRLLPGVDLSGVQAAEAAGSGQGEGGKSGGSGRQQAKQQADKSAKPASTGSTGSPTSSSSSATKEKEKAGNVPVAAYASTGQIVNLMSVDNERIGEALSYLHLIWSSAFQLSIATVMLWKLLGVSMLAGVVVMIVSVPLAGLNTRRSSKLQKGLMKIKDERIKITNEVLSGIRVIKLYAWEIPFKDTIVGIRTRELAQLWRYQICQIIARMQWMAMPTIVNLCAFGAYVGFGNKLDASTAFTAVTLFNMIRFPMSVLPMMINVLMEANVSAARIRSFLNYDEIKPGAQFRTGSFIDTTKTSSAPQSGQVDQLGDSTALKRALIEAAIDMRDVDLCWNEGEEPFLSEVSLRCLPGELTAVLGTTGCGKSGLLQALIGDIVPVRGVLYKQGSIAYVAQTPWIQNATLKENILFGSPFDHQWYEEVIDACALRRDLEIIPSGDATEIGEKGVNLSGGQKQRVSLARAVYSKRELYLLDDCLSAVDAHVASHIMSECILKILHQRLQVTTVLATHSIDSLRHFDQVVFIEKKHFAFVGSYNTLSNTDMFIKFSAAHKDEENETKDEAYKVTETSAQLRRGSDVDEQLITDATSPEVIDQSCGDPSLTGVCPLTSHNLTSDDCDADEEDYGHSTKNTSLSPSPTGSATPVGVTSPRLDAHPRVSVVVGMGEGDKTDSAKRLAEEAKKKDEGALVLSEYLETGEVTFDVYKTYFRAAGGLPFVLSTLVLVLMYQSINVSGGIWISYWSEHLNKVSNKQGIGVFGTLSLSAVLASFIFNLSLGCAVQRTAGFFHSALINGVIRAPMSFFDSTPTGRILNRFSTDIYCIDERLPGTIQPYLTCITSILATCGVICYVTPMFVPLMIPLAYFYIMVQNFYIPSSRQLQRLNNVLRSPVYSNFGETLSGASTIRAFAVQERFKCRNQELMDKQLRAYYMYISSNRWLAVRLEGVGAVAVASAGLLAVVSRRGLPAGLAGLAITYSLNITQALSWAVRMASDRESQAVSVERVVEYSYRIEPEAAAVVDAHRPPAGWPAKGAVAINDLCVRYRDNLPLVLKHLNVNVLAGEKVGIVGRTGAGKSSLLGAILRLVEPASGNVVIDGEQLELMGLTDLRSKLSIIPQDPVFFTGTLRFNIDPAGEYGDHLIWEAIGRAHLYELVTDLPDGLDSMIEEGGRNLSMGQRQLLCLARALLRRSKVLLLDEATSAVDPFTDSVIQETISQEFGDCTILTIAHRINTIANYDKIMVLDEGEVKEFAPPLELYNNSKSIFHSMCVAASVKPSGAR
eukprot:GHVN01000727.1.p1 GENE.GHVN01000727.1~~GHVN01000727.1.p1  ORF type:complete len:1703 (+),score=255.01 GHVN01000727.1:12362-17470(+)